MTYLYRIACKNGELDTTEQVKKHILAYVIAGSENYAYAVLDIDNLCAKNVHKVDPIKDNHDIMMILFFFACLDEDEKADRYNEMQILRSFHKKRGECNENKNS